MKKYLLTGLIILLPVALTLMIISFLFDLFTTPFVQLFTSLLDLIQIRLALTLPDSLILFLARLSSLLFLGLFIFLLGFITRWFFIKSLLQWGQRIIDKIPIVKTVYKVSKDILSALFSTDGKKAIKHAVLVPFPEHPNFCVGFQAGEVAEECQKKVDSPLVSVFIPTAPHPISGFLLLMPEKDVKKIQMGNEDVIKLLVSCGMVVPDVDKPLRDLPHELS